MGLTLDGRIAIVTGAGGGLGRAYARELGRRGAFVVVNDVGGSLDGAGAATNAADGVVEEIRSSGGTAVASYDSVATPEGGEAIVATAVEAFGRVDVLVNNAGILRDRSMGKLDWDDVAAVLGVHLGGALHVTQPAFRAMKQQQHGRLIFCSSNAGTFGNFGQSVYAAAKGAVIGLSNVLAIEGARSGVTSNVICPVATTRMTEAMLGELAAPLDPARIAPLVAYLASDECDLTHHAFSAGGNHVARVFTGLTRGWTADGELTAEDLAAHVDEVTDTTDHLVPMSAGEELELLRGILLG